MIFCSCVPNRTHRSTGDQLPVVLDETPGIEVRPLKTMTGDRRHSTKCFSPTCGYQGLLVGKRGEGWFVANATLRHERDCSATRTPSRLNALVRADETRRRSNGTRLIDAPVFRDRLGG